MRMQDKVALVTGGGSGIGRATALLLAAEGARVVCADRDVASAQATAKAIQDAGGTALALEVDVADERACTRLVEATVSRFGGLTTLVNSAGVRAPLDALPPPAQWQRVIDINLTGSYLMSRAAIPALRARRWPPAAAAPSPTSRPSSAWSAARWRPRTRRPRAPW